MNYKIFLHQSSMEIQNLGESDSWEEITKLWEDAKADDDYAEMDEWIALYKEVDDEHELIEDYTIPKSQQNF